MVLPGLLTFDESVFFHGPTHTPIVADVLKNAAMPASTLPLRRLGYRIFRLDGTLSVFSVLRRFSLTNRASRPQGGASDARVGAGTPHRWPRYRDRASRPTCDVRLRG